MSRSLADSRAPQRSPFPPEAGPLRLAAILPHTLLFGGVKRYVELGNRFVGSGHAFTLFTPDGLPPSWCVFRGDVKPLTALRQAPLDVVMTSEEAFLADLLAGAAPLRIFYVISKNKALRRIARHPDIVFFANSSGTFDRVRRYARMNPVRAFGGVRMPDEAELPSRHKPSAGITVMTYGRLSRQIKGTRLVVKACEKLRRDGLDIRVLLFDTPVNDASRALVREFQSTVPFEFVLDHPVDRMGELFARADLFAIAEKKGGWSNTCAEAMSYGVPVVATATGTRDFLRDGETGIVVRRNVGALARAIRRLAQSPELRAQLGASGREHIAAFQWDGLADRILSFAADWFNVHPHLADLPPGFMGRVDPRRSRERRAAAVVERGWPFAARLVAETKVSKPRSQAQERPLLHGVYILCYHSIVDPAAATEWERAYHQVATPVPRFIEQIDYLKANATPIALSRVPELLRSGRLGQPYFAITLDDGYSNWTRNAAPVLREKNITPAAFVCSRFLLGKAVYTRVLAALLQMRGAKAALSDSHRRIIGRPIPWGHDPLRFLKRTYRYGVTEEVILDAWQRTGETRPPDDVHLTLDGARALAAGGWEIGNHTASHATLAALDADQQAAEIEECGVALAAAGIPSIQWLAYPNGGVGHVNELTRRWLLEHEDWNGAFCGGGVNVAGTRTEWLRIGVGAEELPDFQRLLWASGERMSWSRHR